ncbi:MAG: DNA gyrase subunit A [Gammaproteobacteria bacterium]|nr:DNA gyrase subunit A [Gammaproteobacteria bacterium]
MTDFAKEVTSVNIEEELKHSYLDYAMSVIVGRALPDVRDGLKPVHRRVLFAMSELGNDWNKAYKKSARIVGDVIGKYHPHGDTAVYDTIVRMAQPFSLRYMLVDGQGNFGSVDGDAPAAMRYTEIRMSKFAHSLLADLEKETVEFVPNYDETELAPTVLPTRIPNLLVNGSSGIAVGMATNIPPHNLNEVIDACIALIDDQNLTTTDLMQYIPGPDFPTAAIINGRAGILEAYQTGRGRIYLRARTSIETDEDSNKQTILIHELPYQVNKARLLEKIGELVKEKKLEGITAIRDESDKDGMRVVIELRRGENGEVVLNNLYAHTQMATVFGINIVALDQGQPRVLNLKDLLEAFIRHRREVVTKRSVYELKKARERAHLLEGLGIALVNIDRMIAIIKASPNPAQAKEQLLAITWPIGNISTLLSRTDNPISRPINLEPHYGLSGEGYSLSPAQAQAILELRLHRLTGLEQEKIFSEYENLLKIIVDLLDILGNPTRLMNVIRDELNEIKNEFGDARRTEIIDSKEVLSLEDLISEEDVVVTISHLGYAKIQSLDAYHAQRRGGRGKSAAQVKEEDYISHLLIANTHDNILCFSNRGKVYWLKVYQIPQASRIALGRPLVNLLPLEGDERISAILSVREFAADQYVMMVTSQGVIKKVSLEQFSRPRANGIIAIDMNSGDDLVGVHLTDGDQDVMLFSDTGKVIRFHEGEVRPMGRSARGVRGMRLQTSQQVIALIVAKAQGSILTATENGYGKRTDINEYRRTGRGGQGVISIQVNERNGQVVGAVQVADEDEILLISNRGTLVRTRVSEISLLGRNTQGVRLINLSNDEKLVGIQPVVEKFSDEEIAPEAE